MNQSERFERMMKKQNVKHRVDVPKDLTKRRRKQLLGKSNCDRKKPSK